MSLTASQITNLAKIMLVQRDVYTWRNNQIPVKGRVFIGEAGCSDLIGMNVKTGQFVACEVKTKMDRMSPDQKRFLKMVKDYGGVSLVAIEDKGGNAALVDIDDYLIGKKVI